MVSAIVVIGFFLFMLSAVDNRKIDSSEKKREKEFVFQERLLTTSVRNCQSDMNIWANRRSRISRNLYEPTMY